MAQIPLVQDAGGEGAMLDFMAITKALADENRIRLLLALQERELCVCQLIELIGLAPSTVSKHMAILLEIGAQTGPTSAPNPDPPGS